MRRRSLPRGLAQAGGLASAIIAVHTAANLRRVQTISPGAAEFGSSVSLLLPVRNEEQNVAACLAALQAQRGVDELEIVILDDGSTDDTAAVVQRIAGDDPRVKLLDADDVDPPPGWRGKTWACHRLAEQATGSVLVFVDADVVLSQYAVAAAATALRNLDAQLISPYPRQLAGSVAERLTQPLVTWSWIATLPLPLAERGPWMFAAAIGQFLVADAEAFRACGGHSAVRGHVVEDAALARHVKRSGYRVVPMDGSRIAECRMYNGAGQVYDGYTKSLWDVFGSTVGAAGGVAAMMLIYVIPPVAAIASRDRSARRWGALGFAAGVAGRAMVARRTGERAVPDALGHPASIGAFAALTVASVIRHGRGSLRWKSRPI